MAERIVRWPALEEDDLWRRFDRQHNEMIITKAGRCLFPILRVRFEHERTCDVSGPVAVDPEERYAVLVSMQPVDRLRWRFRHGRWRPAGSLSDAAADAARAVRPAPRLPEAHEPPAVVFRSAETGASIIRGLSFDSVKVTNASASTPGVVALRSFHRYVPVVHLLAASGAVQSFSFGHTAFVAVTHYQNDATTALKKSYNPHAKGFLPGGAHGRAAAAGSIARGPRTPEPTSLPSSLSPGDSSGLAEDGGVERDVFVGALALHGIATSRRLSLE